MSNQQRDRAAKLVHKDSAAAARLARQISEAPYAAQALASVGRFSPAAAATLLIQESLAAAKAAADPYHRVMSAAWPLRAMAELETLDQATVVTVVGSSSDITTPGGRTSALLLVLDAAWPAGRRCWLPVAQELLDALVSHWRDERNLQHAALLVTSEDAALAIRLAEKLRQGRIRRQLDRQLAAGERREPRPFFW